MAAMIIFLWLCVLLTADFGAAGSVFANNEDQCLVTLIVNMAKMVQEQSDQLEQQSAQLQEQSGVLRSLQDKVSSMESSQKWSTVNLTKINNAQSRQEQIFQQQSDDLRSLQDLVKLMQSSLEWNRHNLTALNETHFKQDRILQQQLDDQRSLQDKVNSVETDLDWITGNLTALHTTRAKPVAFSVQYQQDPGHIISENGTLKFPILVSNIGEGYSSHTGHFTAPYAGAYAFYGSLRSSNDHLWTRLGIYKGANTLLVRYTAQGNDDTWDRGSGLVTTHLQQGDIVYVRHNRGSSYLEAGPFTTFSGMLLAAD